MNNAAFKSIPISVISLMQSKFSTEKLKDQVEKVMMKGLRRSAGLNLLSFAMQINVDRKVFLDLLQWFLTSLRANRN